MDCTTSHLIDLQNNFGESFVLNRRVFLLSGSINAPCSCQYVVIRSVNKGLSWNVSLTGRKFKHLIRLIKDCDNVIELNYCNAQLTLHLYHKSIENVHYDIQPLYIINKNSDGCFQSTLDDANNKVEDALIKINLALELAQCIISSKFIEKGFGERSFVLQKCQIFDSNLDADKARNMTQWELYDAVAEELVVKEGIDIKDRRKFVGFLSCTKFEGLKDDEDYSYVNIKAKTFANPALGGGFLCLMGSGCFFSWPNHIDEVSKAFSSRRKIDLSQVLDDSNYRKTYGGCFSTTLGSLVHEMGHVFDLAHTETGLMGNDIDFVHRFFLSENFTEILQKRIVRNCQVNHQNNSKTSINQRFTKLKKPGGQFLEKYYEQKNNDMTFFEPNCLITLWFHRWFTQVISDSENLTFCSIERKVRSRKSSIKLVEIRELDKNDSMLISYWSLLDKNVNEFQIPLEAKRINVSLFAITCQGEILKKDLT